MRNIININKNWEFYYKNSDSFTAIDLPHTWNNIDGQDGGNDYFRGKCTYVYRFDKPELNNQEFYIEFKGCRYTVSSI